jgi:hypothetical protein
MRLIEWLVFRGQKRERERMFFAERPERQRKSYHPIEYNRETSFSSFLFSALLLFSERIRRKE